MKTQDEEATSWDDMMFENRNKDYGAYVIRKSYSDNMITGEVMTFFFIAFLFTVPLLLNRFGIEFGTFPRTKGPSILTIIAPPIFKQEERNKNRRSLSRKITEGLFHC